MIEVAKPCPGCGVFIRKNVRSDEMTCSNCNMQFCWLCLVEYKGPRHDQQVCDMVQQTTRHFVVLQVAVLSIVMLGLIL